MCGVHNIENEIIRYCAVDRNGELILIETEIANAKRRIHSKVVSVIVVSVDRKSAVQRSAIMGGIVVTLRGLGNICLKVTAFKWDRVIVQFRFGQRYC